MTIDRVIKKFQENYPQADSKIISRAYDFAENAHTGQTRKSGEPYIQHSLHTAYVLAESKMDLSTVAAGLLHDVPEDTEHTLEEIKKLFGEEIQTLVKGVTKLGKLKYRGVERYKENLKKMFIAIAGDLRIIYIKFADRLHNLRTLEALPDNKRERIAKETLEIYAPIAGLLGAWRLKWQMEDICFKNLYPEDYKKLEYKYDLTRHSSLAVVLGYNHLYCPEVTWNPEGDDEGNVYRVYSETNNEFLFQLLHYIRFGKLSDFPLSFFYGLGFKICAMTDHYSIDGYIGNEKPSNATGFISKLQPLVTCGFYLRLFPFPHSTY